MSKKLGQYTIGDRLAAGGMAEIFHAEPLSPGRYSSPIVVKKMLPHLAADRNFVNMFVDEARISSRLKHPNIVTLFEFHAGDDGLYIVLEYVDGPDLLTLLKGGARRKEGMPPEIAVYITCHVLEALDYAHSADIDGQTIQVVHRDVSPGNVLISSKGLIKLADFGIARASNRKDESTSDALKGKYGYMSPEQIDGKPLDGRSDLFSAAVVLTELLLSKRLYAAPNQLDILLMVRNADLSRLDKYGEHLDPALVRILKKAMSRQRSDRYPTAGEFRDALAEWLAAQPNRTGAHAVCGFIDSLSQGGFIEARAAGPGNFTISGTQTRAGQMRAQGAAQLGREIFEMGTVASADIDLTLGAAGVTAINQRPASLDKRIERDAISALEGLERGGGALTSALTPLHLVGAISALKLTGVLSLERETIFKEVFFVDGDPVFVASNDHRERFGQFLVDRGLITRDELRKAIGVMPHFGGRLGQAIVGLKLLSAVDAVRLLAEQVSEKLLRVVNWDEGRFVWELNKEHPSKIVPLHLSSPRLVARGVKLLSDPARALWIESRAKLRPVFTSLAPFESFGFGPTLARKLEGLDGSIDIETFLAGIAPKHRGVVACAVLSVLLCSPA